MKKNKTWFFALIGLVTVASLFTVCKASGAGGDLFSTLFDHTIEVGYDEFRALQPTERELLGLDPGKLAEPVPVGGGIALSDGNNILGVKIGRFDAEKYTLKVYDPDLDGDNNPDTPNTGTPKWPAGGLFVTFDADGGILEGGDTAEVAPGGTVGDLPSASLEDYTFGFWWTEPAGGGSRFDGGTVVNGDITVYAKWISLDASRRALSFELYGGSLSGSIPDDNPQIVGVGANAARPLPDPHKTGYIFDGWFDAESDGSEIAWPLTITEDRTVHARWTEVASPTFGITLSKTGTHTFAEASEGYGEQAALSVTVTNTGNRPAGQLTVTLAGTDEGKFERSTATIDSIAAGESGTGAFTVKPAAGSLRVGAPYTTPYTATVTVSGENDITASFALSFLVYPPGSRFVYNTTTTAANNQLVFLGEDTAWTGKATDNERLAMLSNTGAKDSTLNFNSTDYQKQYIRSITWASDDVGNVTAIPANFLYDFTGITALDLSVMTNIDSVGDYFLYECLALKTLDLTPLKNVTTIGNSFIHSCRNALTKLDLTPLKDVVSIGNWFIANNWKLTELVMPPEMQVSTIGEYFLSGCIALKVLDLTPLKNVTKIGGSFLFGNRVLTSLDLSAMTQVTEIGTHFLKECVKLTSVNMGSITYDKIAVGAFNLFVSGSIVSCTVKVTGTPSEWAPYFLNPTGVTFVNP
jgi:uncharacterized repeat protein (TIGR02543 family)